MILFMEEILHHLECIKPCKYWGNSSYQLVRRISSINSISQLGGGFEYFLFPLLLGDDSRFD